MSRGEWPNLKWREVEWSTLEEIVTQAKAFLSPQYHETLKAALETLAFLTREVEAKGASIRRLRRMLFGPSTEKTSQVCGEESPTPGEAAGGGVGSAERPGEESAAGKNKTKRKRPGHGRNGAASYRGAAWVKVPHASLSRGDRCPKCEGGKLCLQTEPAVVVQVKGVAPLSATVWEMDRLRCHLCGTTFTAQAPEGVGQEKYDESAAAMIGVLKYGAGLPFNRLERLQANLGIPLPASTQWDVVHRAAGSLQPAYEELVRQAAQGEVLHNDDTTMKVLELGRSLPPGPDEGQGKDKRTGVFTSGIVSAVEGHRIALFFTGRKHAGENLADVLAERGAELAPPIQMCDGLSRNTTGEFETIVANCNAHARRRFVDVANNFPAKCRYVLETIREVYRNDAVAQHKKMSPEDRLRLHQTKSGPLMEGLKTWLQHQFDQRKVEPNSPLGEAIGYMQRHWHKLTLFLRVPGAPLDNNLVERILKRAILHRKNALFYKTLNGARVGDMFMSLIVSAELHGANAFDYLVALLRHDEAVAKDPSQWLPWNYQEAVARLSSKRDPPP